MVSEEKIVEIISSTDVVDEMSQYEISKSFKENGIDSLDVFTIFLAVEEQLGVKFSETESTSVKSVPEMVALLNSR